MEFVQKYRILFIVTLAFAGGAFYEINYVNSVSDYVPGMGQPNPAAELLIELYNCKSVILIIHNKIIKIEF